MNYELESVRPRGGPKKTWCEVIEKDCQTQQLRKEDDMKLINVNYGCCAIDTKTGRE